MKRIRYITISETLVRSREPFAHPSNGALYHININPNTGEWWVTDFRAGNAAPVHKDKATSAHKAKIKAKTYVSEVLGCDVGESELRQPRRKV